ncbi:dihydrodipicolinate synthase family protein [Microbacterium sp. JZ70]
MTSAAFTGVSAFPLTPLRDDALDRDAYAGLVERLARSEVDTITALGSTGCAPYLSRAERAEAVRIAVESAGEKPVLVGIGALRASEVRALAADAQEAGAAGLLLPALSYQPLTHDEVFALFEALTAEVSVPVVVYDNPTTTGFAFTDDLLERVAALPHIASIKIPGVPAEPLAARERVGALRGRIPESVSVGISVDPLAAAGLAAGCAVWYSVVGGLFPRAAMAIAEPAGRGDHTAAAVASERLEPLWQLFRTHGSLRVVAALAGHLGLTADDPLPRPLRALEGDARRRAVEVAHELGLDEEL